MTTFKCQRLNDVATEGGGANHSAPHGYNLPLAPQPVTIRRYSLGRLHCGLYQSVQAGGRDLASGTPRWLRVHGGRGPPPPCS
jgi:hypothetical protein